MKNASTERIERVVGLDLGDRYSQVCVVSMADGSKLEARRVKTTPTALWEAFGGKPRMRIALEAGTHSPWVSRLLVEAGHEVLVAHPRRLRLIYENRRKDDRVDAESLARLARVDPQLLSPIQHREVGAQAALAMVKARHVAVRSRAHLILHCRGAVKSLGGRLPSCSTESFATKAWTAVPEALHSALQPLFELIAAQSERIATYDAQIEQLAAKHYPETTLLRTVPSVGGLTALAYVLILGEAGRFARSRTVGGFVGLVPARAASGASDPQLRISKEGNQLLRWLLVQCAQRLLGPFGPDCELKRFGQRLAQRGGRAAKKKAVVAVARKLAVVLHALWRTGQVYDPFLHSRRAAA